MAVRDSLVFIITIPGNPISEYYTRRTEQRFWKHGHKYTQILNATEPDDINGRLIFGPERIYTEDRSRPWNAREKAIWHSHYEAWKTVSWIDYTAVIAEHDCVLKRPLQESLAEHDVFSFASVNKNRPQAGVGYYITQKGARDLIGIAHKMSRGNGICVPVDAVIHSYQMGWYPYGKFDKEFIDKYISANHFINEEVGTTKGNMIRKK